MLSLALTYIAPLTQFHLHEMSDQRVKKHNIKVEIIFMTQFYPIL